jgi:hypothetical protein
MFGVSVNKKFCGGIQVDGPCHEMSFLYRFPLVGEFTCQNAMLAERFVEGGSTYALFAINP